VIKSIYATNFRRYGELSLNFDEDRQLILISGNNGVGKSTILEVITYALWGEGRNGKRNLDNLLKRGAELEGMSAQLVFTVGEDTYRVIRRRDGKNSTAVLYANDTPLVEGPIQVSASIEALLGMDSAGFKLAVVAQQKDLDGLASLRPHERSLMVSRLLRLDVLTAARNVAQTLFKKERDISKEIVGEDAQKVEEEIRGHTDTLADYEKELASVRASMADLDETLSKSRDVRERWENTKTNTARIEGALSQVEQAQEDLAAQLNYLVLADIPVIDVNVESLALEIAENERDLLRATTAQAAIRQRKVLEDEIALIASRRDALNSAPKPMDEASRKNLKSRIDHGKEKIARATAQHNETSLRIIELNFKLNEVQTRLNKHRDLEDVCDTCGQEVSVEYRTSLADTLATEKANLTAKLEDCRRMEVIVREDKESSVAETGKLSELLQEDTDLVKASANDTRDLLELERREKMYTSQVERLEVAPVDIDAVYSRKADIALKVSRLGEYDNAVKERQKVINTMAKLEEQIALNAKTITSLKRDLAAAAPGEELLLRHAEMEKTEQTKKEEQELVNYWLQEVAVLQSRIVQDKKRLDLAKAVDLRRAEHHGRAVAAAAAGRLLSLLSDTLATRLRPNLESAVSSILGTMSSSRFLAVKIDDDYTVTVNDQGKFVSLADLSGGEVDLVALSLRLALSQVVSERHGAGGAGFLVLDECFASQDRERRQSILDGLRNMRDVYSQIFIVSHVENIEDSADMVIAVDTDQDREDTEVTVI